jgi:uncharacterized damage-inducible protein DinB
MTKSATFMTPEALLEHWEGHQRLTRRLIEAYPEDKLFSFEPAPPMRPFGELALEIIGMIAPTMQGLKTGEWESFGEGNEKRPSKAELLTQWDEAATILHDGFPQIPEARFHEVDTAFGQWTMPGYEMALYLIDNEIHHRSQGYVYLRLLGIEPPPFYER